MQKIILSLLFSFLFLTNTEAQIVSKKVYTLKENEGILTWRCLLSKPDSTNPNYLLYIERYNGNEKIIKVTFILPNKEIEVTDFEGRDNMNYNEEKELHYFFFRQPDSVNKTIIIYENGEVVQQKQAFDNNIYGDFLLSDVVQEENKETGYKKGYIENEKGKKFYYEGTNVSCQGLGKCWRLKYIAPNETNYTYLLSNNKILKPIAERHYIEALDHKGYLFVQRTDDKVIFDLNGIQKAFNADKDDEIEVLSISDKQDDLLFSHKVAKTKKTFVKTFSGFTSHKPYLVKEKINTAYSSKDNTFYWIIKRSLRHSCLYNNKGTKKRLPTYADYFTIDKESNNLQIDNFFMVGDFFIDTQKPIIISLNNPKLPIKKFPNIDDIYHSKGLIVTRDVKNDSVYYYNFPEGKKAFKELFIQFQYSKTLKSWWAIEYYGYLIMSDEKEKKIRPIAFYHDAENDILYWLSEKDTEGKKKEIYFNYKVLK